VSQSRPVAVWNPVSGSAPSEDDLRAALPEGIDLVETSADDPGTGQSADAARSGAPAVVACGGDGTIRACLQGVVGSDTALGLIPLGTGNLLALNMDIPSGLDAAPDALRREPVRVDVGRVGDEAFLVMAGTGFDARMISGAEDLGKAKVGRLAYVLAAIKNVPARLVRTTVVVDGAVFFRGRTSMVLVGNLPTITGGLDVFPAADPADGLLDVGVLRASTAREWVRVAWALLWSRPQPDNLVTRTQGTSVSIISDKPRPYQLDGEHREPSDHIVLGIEPAAVTLLTGPAPEDHKALRI